MPENKKTPAVFCRELKLFFWIACFLQQKNYTL